MTNFRKIKFDYPQPTNAIDKAKEQLKRRETVRDKRTPIETKDIQPIYDMVNDIIHHMDDRDGVLLGELQDVRDDLYSLLR